MGLKFFGVSADEESNYRANIKGLCPTGVWTKEHRERSPMFYTRHFKKSAVLFCLAMLFTGCSRGLFTGGGVKSRSEAAISPPLVDELSSTSTVDEGQAFLARTLYEQLVLVYERVQATIGNERIDYGGIALEDVEEDLQLRVEDGEGEIFGEILMRELIEDANEDPDIAVTLEISSGDIADILEMRERIIDRGISVYHQGTQDDEFDSDLDTGLELIAVKGRAGGGSKDGEEEDGLGDVAQPNIDCPAARKSEALGGMVAATCAVPAAKACVPGVPVSELNAACIESLACEIGSIVSAWVAAEASFEGDCR